MEKDFIFDPKTKQIKQKIKISAVISDLSFGVLNKLCDLVLVGAILCDASLRSGGIANNFARETYRMLENTPGVDVRKWLEGFRTVRTRKWIDGNAELTKEGKKRLQGIVPVFPLDRKWDGNWHVVVFDVPEHLRKERAALRECLRKMGFGRLQDSVWISPINFLGTIQRLAEEMGLGNSVLCCKTTNLGELDAQDLAHRVWDLSALNEKYKAFLEYLSKNGTKYDSMRILFWYLSILQSDPQLPGELLPQNWSGDPVHSFMHSFLDGNKGMRGLIFLNNDIE